MAIDTITQDKCVGCKKCIDVCPMDVFRWDEEQNQPQVVHFLDCITCFNCELNCPSEAIYVDPKRAKPVILPW